MARQERRRRAGGRAGNRDRRSGELFPQMPWRVPVNLDAPTEPLDEDGIQAIHAGAMHILEAIGVEFLNEEALEIFKEAGCK
ncbi:MAG: methyltransferase, partial [Boseongicola sp. SB0676_bin_33]|nr:methyltransferase [Boseongicola sp. SB0676_bin_33]